MLQVLVCKGLCLNSIVIRTCCTLIAYYFNLSFRSTLPVAFLTVLNLALLLAIPTYYVVYFYSTITLLR